MRLRSESWASGGLKITTENQVPVEREIFLILKPELRALGMQGGSFRADRGPGYSVGLVSVGFRVGGCLGFRV